MQIIITRANAIIACELITIIRMRLFVLKGKVNCLAGLKEKTITTNLELQLYNPILNYGKKNLLSAQS